MKQQPKSKRDEVWIMLWIIDKFSLKKHQKWNFDSNQKENKANVGIAFFFFLCLDIVEYIYIYIWTGNRQKPDLDLMFTGYTLLRHSKLQQVARTLNKSKPWWFYRRKTCSNFFRKEFSQTQNLADFSIS
jgi:hypothetical protein